LKELAMDIAEQLNALNPIKEDAVELRVDVDFHWPEGLEVKEWWASQGMHSTIREAASIFREFRSVRDEATANKLLSAEGAFAEVQAWSKDQLPRLVQLREKARERMAKAEQDTLEALSSDIMDAPYEPVDEMRLRELRDWVARLPDDKRDDTVRRLLAKGDRKLMRAIMTAPAPYLLGLDEENIAACREDLIRSVDPKKYDRLQKLRKAAEVADRACDGVHRFLTQETNEAAQR
jgi:hypothetical protein